MKRYVTYMKQICQLYSSISLYLRF